MMMRVMMDLNPPKSQLLNQSQWFNKLYHKNNSLKQNHRQRVRTCLETTMTILKKKILNTKSTRRKRRRSRLLVNLKPLPKQWSRLLQLLRLKKRLHKRKRLWNLWTLTMMIVKTILNQQQRNQRLQQNLPLKHSQLLQQNHPLKNSLISHSPVIHQK